MRRRLDVTLLRSKLLAARDVAQHLTKHMKNVEGLLGALKVLSLHVMPFLPACLPVTSPHHTHPASRRLRTLSSCPLP